MDKKITKISCFDFDGTLIDSPLPETGRAEYEKKSGKPWPHKGTGWWGKAESLDISVFEMPVIQSVKDTYEEERVKPEVLMVMMTGRMKTKHTDLSNEVKAILDSKGFTFDLYKYNHGGNTLTNKIMSLDKLLREYADVTDVLLNDDRLEHIPAFEEWGESQLKSGRIKVFKINVVPAGRH
jgi:hypothetical protein